MTSKRKIFTLIILFGMSSTTLPVASRSISLAKKLIQFVLRTPAGKKLTLFLGVGTFGAGCYKYDQFKNLGLAEKAKKEAEKAKK